jgi:hypothetical protein
MVNGKKLATVVLAIALAKVVVRMTGADRMLAAA